MGTAMRKLGVSSPGTLEETLSTCVLFDSVGDMTSKCHRSGTGLGLRMGLLSLVAGESMTGRNLSQTHLWVPVYELVLSEARVETSKGPVLTSEAQSLPNTLFYRGQQRHDPQMVPEPRNDTVVMPQLFWNNLTGLLAEENVSSLNGTDRTDIPWNHEFGGLMVTISVIVMLIFFCGLVGNGIVIWLLGFRIKRNHFSVYILNLAIADFTYLLNVILTLLTNYLNYDFQVIVLLALSSYSVGLSLLMAISVERCVSVLWPIWYKCHRPAHLSTIMCALIWVLFLSFSLLIVIFHYLKIKGEFAMLTIYKIISLPTFLVLFVSSLILFIRVQCYSQQRKPSRVYWTILLNVLVFLLFGVPNGVYMTCTLFMEQTFHSPVILIIMVLLFPMNSTINPFIYYFVGRHRQSGRRKPLHKVLQRAMTDEDEETQQTSGITSSQIEHGIP